MSDYTPEDEEFRYAWLDQVGATDEQFDQFLDRIRATAWDEGAEHAWQQTGEGYNGEYLGGHGTHDGAVSFREARDSDENPYRKADDE